MRTEDIYLLNVLPAQYMHNIYVDRITFLHRDHLIMVFCMIPYEQYVPTLFPEYLLVIIIC